VDNKGSYIAAISGLAAGSVYMIGTDADNCNTYTCATLVTGAATCVDLGGLVTAGYLGSVPISPNGAGTWTAGHTGYTISRATTGILTLRSCENENTAEISVSR